MSKALAVIGAGFGDCGKGHITDYIAANLADPIVVRSNGGAQAGHRVVVGSDDHVFSHWGSGALAGAPTYLSRHFIVNPHLFFQEKLPVGASRSLFCDPRALVTTPYDVLLNHEIERVLQHGSCGAGIWETVVRSEHGFGTLAIRIGDSESEIERKCILIRDEYVLPRFFQVSGKILGGANDEVPAVLALYDPKVLETFLEEVFEFQKIAAFMKPDFLSDFGDVIFEGAQGLLLDQDHRFSPHVTGSHTGIGNCIEIAEEAGLRSLQPVYVTRSYMTRHGAGPFPTEDPNFAIGIPADVNNPRNGWQGAMRYGPLDVSLLRQAIDLDTTRTCTVEIQSPVLAVNHLDQYNDYKWSRLGLPTRYMSHGPDRADIKEIA